MSLSRFTAAEHYSPEDPKLSDGYQGSSRPTPFTGQGIGTVVNNYTSIYNGDATQIPKGSIGGYTVTNSAVPTVTAAIQTPNTFYWLQVGKETWESTWYNFADISLWSDYGVNKSIYDPCPYGYRVPNNGSWAGLPKAGWTIDTINEGTVWNNTWWLASGLRNSNSGALTYVGVSGYSWSSTRSDAYLSYHLYLYYTGQSPTTKYTYRSNGIPVRCVQERAKSTIIFK